MLAEMHLPGLQQEFGPANICVNAVLPGIIAEPRMEGMIADKASLSGVSHEAMKADKPCKLPLLSEMAPNMNTGNNLMMDLVTQRLSSIEETRKGPPARTLNPFFGVGPITDVIRDEVAGRKNRFDFDRWVEKTYRKRDDKGHDLGPFTTTELGRSMHRGYPADAILLDMMHHIHRYFRFAKANPMAVGLGGGHSGFTVAIMHLMNPNKRNQKIFVDTSAPETPAAMVSGFFRQSWGAQILELQKHAQNGDTDNVIFSDEEGSIPNPDSLEQMGITLFVGVGHETTGATTYTEIEVKSLLEWLKRDPENHHAMIDATSMLGAMPWAENVVQDFMNRCCIFTPFQKAIGGVSGYFLASFTPKAMALIDANQKDPAWAIPRQMKLVVPSDPKRPLTGEKSVALGPFYDATSGEMTGGVINTFSSLAFAETTFSLLRVEDLVGSVGIMNERSRANRKCIDDWLSQQQLLVAGVPDPEKRGAAVTLLAVNDTGISDPEIHKRIIARSKQLLGYEGLTHPDGSYEAGLDVARYVNAFPGTAGDYRAWIGGIRDTEDIVALLENISYAYHRAKIVVLEEELAKQGTVFDVSDTDITKPGGGSDTSTALASTAANAEALDGLRESSEALAAIWGAIQATHDPIRRAELLTAHGMELALATSNLRSSCDALGLTSAFEK